MIRVLETRLKDLSPQAKAFLQSAYDRMQRQQSLEDFVSTGTIYTIYLDDVVVGAMYLKTVDNIIGIELFGSDSFDEIKWAFSEFAADLCRLNNTDQILFKGRAGFYKKLPEFECLGTIYRFVQRGVAFQ